MPTLHEAQENMRKLVEQDQRNAEARRVYARHLLNEAAPYMYDALQQALLNEGKDGCIGKNYCTCWRCLARAAIAKAKGESKPLATSEVKSE